MDCKVCGCAACYYNDCCDHTNPVEVQDYKDLDYMEWYDEYMTGADIPSWEKIKRKQKERTQ